jgi:PAS domain S-box-containing protein
LSDARGVASLPVQSARSPVTALAYPSSDAVFAARVQEIVGEVDGRDVDAVVQALQRRLRPVHPQVVSRPRTETAGLGLGPIVYVFRDGTAMQGRVNDDWMRASGAARVVTDPSGAYIEANDAAGALFGVPRAQIIGGQVGTFTAPDARLRDADPVWRALKTSGRLHSFTLVQCPDGMKRAVEFVTVRDTGPVGCHVTYLRAVV